MENINAKLYDIFLKRQIPALAEISTFFTLVSFLLPNHVEKLFWLVLLGVLVYVYLREMEAIFILDVFKNHTVMANLDQLNDQKLSESWVQYTFWTAAILTVALAVLTYVVNFTRF
jgi:hypothetical protein